MEWQKFLKKFEEDILIGIFNSKEIPYQEPVPVRPGKLSKTDFGKFIGNSFEFDGILAFNYYGHFKISSGLLESVPEGRNVIYSPVIHFSSVKIEHIVKFNKDLLMDFVSFKDFIVGLRWDK